MTYTKKQVLPALHHSGKVKAPDMPDVEDKNYTATILKYANLALPFPQLDTNSKTVVAAINELYAHPGGSIVIPNPPLPTEDSLTTESGEVIEIEQGGTLDTEQGGGGGTVTPLTSISIDGDIFSIEGEGGTTVIANPSDTATSLLYKLKVAETTYTVQGFEIISKLTAGQTTLSITDSKITTNSTFNVYTNPYGVVLSNIIATSGNLTLVFEEQQQDVDVKVRIT